MKDLTALIKSGSNSPYPQNFEFPYLIAEAGVNHEGDIDVARRLIDEAKEGGADAIKFQTYKASTIASKNSPSYWDLTKEPTDSQFNLFQKYDKFWKDEFVALSEYCRDVNIDFLSTPFDVESASFLSELMPVFKISSSDMNNKPFIEFICQFGKPLILSTGASYLWEIEQTLSWIDLSKNPVSLLHCVLNYPTDDENANLAVIKTLIDKFPHLAIGYSDHTMPKDMKTLEIAAILGAKIIEKHFTHDKELPGNDHYHAMDKNDLKTFKSNLNRVFEIIGSSVRAPLNSEILSRKNARRSLVAAKDIKANSLIQASDITWKRPGLGIDPRDLSQLVGMKSKKDIESDTVLQWNLFY